MADLTQSAEVFETNRDNWSHDHRGQYVVLVGDRLIGFFDDLAEAYQAGKDEAPPGEFFIGHCLPKNDEPRVVFHSRVR